MVGILFSLSRELSTKATSFSPKNIFEFNISSTVLENSSSLSFPEKTKFFKYSLHTYFIIAAPFTLTSKEGDGSYQEFLNNESRYTRLIKPFPERAERLFNESEKVAKARYEHLQRLVELYK